METAQCLVNTKYQLILKVEADEWSDLPTESYTSNGTYKVSGNITISSPGTYEFNGQIVELISGSMVLHLNKDIKDNEKFTMPVINKIR